MNIAGKIARFLTAILFLFPVPVLAQLTWGTGGAGGAGVWNSSNLNWYNGTTDVAWTAGNTGTFTGTGGVISVSGTQTVRQLIFSSSSGSYSLTGGTLTGTAGGLNILATSGASISSSIVGTAGSVLTESGAGFLNLSGTVSGFSQLNLSGTMLGGTVTGTTTGLTISTPSNAVLGSVVVGTGSSILTKSGTATLTLLNSVSGFSQIALTGTITGGTVNGLATGLTIATASNATLGSTIVGAFNSTLSKTGSGTLTLASTVSNFTQLNVTGAISGGTINGGSSGLLLQTTTAGSIDSLIKGTAGTTLTKTGTGTLTLGLSPVIGFSQINLTAGSMSTGAPGWSGGTGATINLTNAANVVLLVSGSASFGSISGGGSLGGVVKPLSTTGTATLVLQDVNGSSFDGVLSDNGGGQLGLLVLNNQTLTGVSTYTGTTSVGTTGTLTLTGTASIANSGAIGVGGILKLDNSVTDKANRLSTTVPIQMGGGTFLYQGNSSAASAETFGQIQLYYGGSSRIVVNAGAGQTAIATFTGLSNPIPRNGAMIDFSGTGTTHITGFSNTNGIIGAYATYGSTEWAALDGSQNVVAYTGYNSNINSVAITDNVKVSGGGLTTLAASEQINTLALQNTSSTVGTLDLNGQTLYVTYSGILSNGSGNNVIQNGNIIGLNDVLDITNDNTLTISAQLAANVPLYKAGSGTLILTGTNTFAWPIEIIAGTVQIGNGGTTGSVSSTTHILGNSLIFDRSDTLTQGVDFSGDVLGLYVNSLTQAGSGTLVLSSQNDIKVLTVQNGTVSFNWTGPPSGQEPLGTGTTVYLGGSGTTGTLQFTGTTTTMNKRITATGNGVLLNSGGGILTIAGTITKNGTVLTFGGGAFNITGLVTGGTTSTFNSDLVVTGGSTVTLSNSANNYTGPTYIYGGGTLKNGVTNALPSGTVLTLGNAGDNAVTNTFDLNGNNQSLAALNSVGDGGNIHNVVTNGGASGTGTLTLSGTNSDGLTVSSSFGGTIQNGTTSATALKISGGTHTLSGSNTYTGGTTVSGGALIAGTSTFLATIGGTTTIASGPFGTGRLSLSTGATLEDNGTAITLANSLSLSGTVTFGSTGGGSLVFDGTTLSTPATITLIGATSLIVNNTTTFADNISGNFSLTKLGTGILNLTGTNSSTGGTTVTAGSLAINNGTNLGSGAISLANGTGLQYVGTTNGTFTQSITVTGTAGSSATLINSSGNVLTLAGTLTKNGTTLNISGGRNVITGAIVGSSAHSDVNYVGGTTTGLMTADTYNGPTSISGGSTVLTGVDNALPGPGAPNTDLTLGAGADGAVTNTLDLLGHSQTVASLTASGTVTTVNQIISSNGSATSPAIGSGASSGTGSLTVNYTGGTTDTYAGLLGDANGTRAANNFSLTKTGTGTLALTQGNSYSGGTDVISGKLVAGNSSGSATGTGALTVESGAILGGTGTITSSNNTINGTVQAGAGGADTSGVLTMTASGTTSFTNASLVFNLSATSLGQSSQLDLKSTASVLFSNTTLTLNLVGAGIIPDTTEYTLLTSLTTGNGAGGSIFSGITVDGLGKISGLNFTFNNEPSPGYYTNSYLKLVSNGTGYNINVEVVPEPATWILFLGGIALMTLSGAHRRKLR